MLKHYEITINETTYEGEAEKDKLDILHKAYEVNSSEIFTLIDSDNDIICFSPINIDFLYISSIKKPDNNPIGFDK